MSPRQILFALAAVFVVAGLFFGTRSVSIDEVSCGSVFSPSSDEAEMQDSAEGVASTITGASEDEDATNNVDACAAAVSDKKPLTYGALGLAGIALIVGFVAPGGTKREPGTKQSYWR